jgi:hypothetical protein
VRRPRPLPRSVVAPGRLATLARDIPTRWGTYSQGLDVLVLDVDHGTVTICLDAGGHMGGKCHRLAVRAGWVR